MDTKQPEALRLANMLEKPGYGWHSTPAECAAELQRLQSENDTLRAGYDAARLEIESLQAQAQQCGAGAGCCAQAARIEELEAQLEAVGADPDDEAVPANAAEIYTQRVIEALYENGDPVSVDAAEELQRLAAQLEAVGAGAGGVTALMGAAVQQVTAPDGWQLVPVEPTKEMVIEAYEAQGEATSSACEEIYRAMLAAAPQPAAQAGWCDGCSPDNCGGCVTPAAPADWLDSVLEDAARYRWLRINAIGAFRTNDGNGPVSVYHLSKIPAIPGIPEETDAAIDAAIAAAPAQAEAPAQAARAAQAEPEDLSVAYFMGLHAAKRAPQPPAQAQDARQPLTNAQIASACMSYRHDFGLLDDAIKAQLMDAAREWERALGKEHARATK